MPLNVFGWCRNSGSAIYGASLPNVLGRTGGTRCSNIEILRIIATFFILLIHANFRFLGEPTIDNMRVTLSMHGVEHYLKL